MSLARWPFRAVRKKVVGRAEMSPGLAVMIGRCSFAVERRQRPNSKNYLAQYKGSCPLAAAQDKNSGANVRKERIAGALLLSRECRREGDGRSD
jgi:hypothetical protein